MDIAVAIGADPATMYSAILPLPPDLDEMMLAGFLRGKPVEMVKCETSDLEVPANSEIVLEGYVELGELRREGPFGDHTGFYSLEDDYPVFHITCVTRRKNPLYATTIVGPPPMEDFYMGKAIERIFLPLMRLQLPEIRDVCMPAEGIFHNLILVAIRKSYPGHARKVMHAIWGLGQAMFSKCIVVVDEDVDVQNVREVAWKALNNIDPERDIQFVMGPVDSLDHSSRLPNYGSKMGVDIIARQTKLLPKTFIGVCGLPQSPGVSPKAVLPYLEKCVKEQGFVGCLINPDPGECGGVETPPLGDRRYPLYEKLVLTIRRHIHSTACRSERLDVFRCTSSTKRALRLFRF